MYKSLVFGHEFLAQGLTSWGKYKRCWIDFDHINSHDLRSFSRVSLLNMHSARFSTAALCHKSNVRCSPLLSEPSEHHGSVQACNSVGRATECWSNSSHCHITHLSRQNECRRPDRRLALLTANLRLTAHKQTQEPNQRQSSRVMHWANLHASPEHLVAAPGAPG